MADPIGFRFDYRSPQAIVAAERSAALLVTQVTAETRAALKALVVKGLKDGITPAKLARLIQDSVGLNTPQAAALLNYRVALEAEGALSALRLEAAVERYREKLLRQRKYMIARTETMRVLNAGKLEAARQAERDGWITGSTKEWAAAPEELVPPVCDECHDLDGDTVGLDSAFSSGDDAPPAHPYCRCSIKIHPGRRKLVASWDPSRFSTPDALLADLQERMGVDSKNVAEWRLDRDMQAAASYGGPNYTTPGDSPHINMSKDATQRIRDILSGKTFRVAGLGMEMTPEERWLAIQTPLHELTHAKSALSEFIDKGSYYGRQISLEEGIVELISRDVASKLSPFAWEARESTMGYSGFVDGMKDALPRAGLKPIEFLNLSSVRRAEAMKEAALVRIEEVAKATGMPSLEREIRPIMERFAAGPGRDAFADFSVDLFMDRDVWRRSGQPISPTGLYNWMSNNGVPVPELNQFLIKKGLK